MDILEVRKVVSQIKGLLFKKSNSFSVGMLKSNFRGSGLQFKEHRLYEAGDDIRFIDWKLVAKTGDSYVKTFEEERNVEISVVIDAGPTMFMGVNNVSKLQAAIEICCLLYLLAEESKDSIRVLILGNKIIDIQKDRGERGIVRLISTLEKERILNHDGKVNLNYSKESAISENERHIQVMKHLMKKREVVLLSDLNEFADLELFKKVIFKSNFHCFKLSNPFDRAERIPFEIFSKRSINSFKGEVCIADFSGEVNSNPVFGKKVKDIKIEERYLENFVKEMI